ncbi:hypothetical protein F4808DRAFT_439823 [Astrocystis sublimbata]|nr:hypothetical protein F4808DRAFT_439823 [Astrocystis sublimbata]
MKISSILATAALAASTVSGWDHSERCEDIQDLCLLDFVWCNRDGDCDFPERSYRRSPSGNVAYPLLISSHTYKISWRASQQNDTPIVFSWQMNNITWEKNLTSKATNFIFRADELLADFPTARHTNVSRGDAWEAASRAPDNRISISRGPLPRGGANRGASVDVGQQFQIASSATTFYLDTQAKMTRDNTDGKWKLGVGIGVGVGVPILLALTAGAAWMAGKKSGGKHQTKEVATPQ